MKILLSLGALLLGAVLGLTLGGRGSAAPAAGSAHTGLTLDRIQALASLVTTRVEVSDVQETYLDGYTGGVKAALLVKGDFELSVDLSAARFEAVEADARTAVLLLPQPQVSRPRLDQDRTRLFAISQKGLWLIVPGSQADTAIVNRAYRDAQQWIASAADRADLIEQARQQAQKVLGCFFTALGWNVQIRWQAAG